MIALDVDCHQSFSFALPCTFPCKNSGRLLLGCGYQIILNFKIPHFFSLCTVKRASVILFKTPDTCMYHCRKNLLTQHFAYPLLEFYSPYGCIYGPPVIDESRRAIFHDDLNCCSTEVDVTEIARAWVGGAIENKGIMLMASEESNLVAFASDRPEFSGMSPILRLTCENITPSQPLSVHDCDVALYF